MSGLTTFLIGFAILSPVVAPVPKAPAPDPLGRGYLGIWFSSASPNGNLLIDRVEPNNPAAKAGLLAGDTVVRVNSLRPQTTQQMIEHVCSYRPGAVIEIEVQRGEEHKTFKVKLAVRPTDPTANRDSYPPLPVFPDER